MARHYRTDVLTERQLEFVARLLPEPSSPTGRPAYTNLDLLPGILRVLRSGCRWRDLDLPGSPSGVTHWRRLRYWQRSKRFKKVWNRVLDVLAMGKRVDRSLLSIDGMLVPSFAFKQRTGYNGKFRRVGTKLSTVVDRNGIPIAVAVAPGNVHDNPLGVLTLANFYRPPSVLRSIANATWGEPSTRLGDRGYDSLLLREFVAGKGLRPNIPHRTCIPAEQACGPLYEYDRDLYKERFVVERTNGWMKSFRRLRFRYDRTIASFEAFLYLAVIVIGVRRAIRS